jgi:hypothetical protein
LFRYRFIKNFRYAEKLYENNRRQTEALQRSSAKSGTKNLKSSNLPAGRQVGKDRFRELAEGGLGGISPTLQILGEICSNFFEGTPPVGKYGILHHHSPAFTRWLTVSKNCQRT